MANSLLNQNEITPKQTTTQITKNVAKISSVTVSSEKNSGKIIPIHSLKNDIFIRVEVLSAVNLPIPNVGIAITTLDNRVITMAVNQFDNMPLKRDENGKSVAEVVFNNIPLARGEYWVDVYLGCENSTHIYDTAIQVAKLTVSQNSMEQGVVHLPHYWIEH